MYAVIMWGLKIVVAVVKGTPLAPSSMGWEPAVAKAVRDGEGWVKKPTLTPPSHTGAAA